MWQSGAELWLRKRHEPFLHDLPEQPVQWVRRLGGRGRVRHGAGPVYGGRGAQ